MIPQSTAVYKLKELARARNGYNSVRSAKFRAKRDGVTFNLTWQYAMSLMPIDMIDVFGGQMKWKGAADGKKTPGRFAPTLDRINPQLGYVKGNVQWLTSEHNLMKQKFSNNELIRKIMILRRNLSLLPE